MKKVATIELGWLGMPLAQSLRQRGLQIVGSKTTQDGVAAARMSGIECYPLVLTANSICCPSDLQQLLQVDILIITFHTVQLLVDTAYNI